MYQAGSDQSIMAIMTVDREHAFYFDHQLDHIPGIMLVAELLKVVRTAARKVRCDESMIAISISFPRFCELDEDIELHAYPARHPGQWNCIATQAEHSVCTGSVHFHGPPPGGRRAVPAYAAASAELMPGYLVHRYRRENILVGRACQEEEGPLRTAVLSPGTHDHMFRLLDRERRMPEELIEAGRQTAVMLWSHSFGWPPDARLMLDSVRAELPVTVDRRVPLELRWWPSAVRGNTVKGTAVKGTAVKGNKAQIPLEVVSRAGDPELLGTITFAMRAVTESAWRRIRSVRLPAPAAGS